MLETPRGVQGSAERKTAHCNIHTIHVSMEMGTATKIRRSIFHDSRGALCLVAALRVATARLLARISSVCIGAHAVTERWIF